MLSLNDDLHHKEFEKYSDLQHISSKSFIKTGQCTQHPTVNTQPLPAEFSGTGLKNACLTIRTSPLGLSTFIRSHG